MHTMRPGGPERPAADLDLVGGLETSQQDQTGEAGSSKAEPAEGDRSADGGGAQAASDGMREEQSDEHLWSGAVHR
jgi:hypothetical protein